ncbi:MAG: S41 family peptidase [Hyphomonadaceae bacterium]
MNLAQSLGIAAASLVLGLSMTPPGAIAQSTTFDRAHIHAAVSELADLMEQSYVFPDIARQYADTLRQRMDTGAYDDLSEPAALAAALQTDLRAVHQDAHLRVGLSEGQQPAGHVRMMGGEQAFTNDRWLAEGVAYFQINVLPEGEETRAAMAALLDRYESANALIIDLRGCRGGTLDAMDVLFSRLYARPTALVTMDTRTGANPELEESFAGASWLRQSRDAPAGVTRWVHWAEPTRPVSDLADARVFLLTDFTASACEHLALSLHRTGRATLVGQTTRGAGHYGGERTFADGRLQVWLPVGRTYDPDTGQGWEGVGIAPDRTVPAEDALRDVLRELNAPVAAADAVPAPGPARRVVQNAPPNRRYGIGLLPPSGGEQSLEILQVDPGFVAANAGVRVGDRIVSLNGTPVSQIAPAELVTYMRGSPLTLVVERGGERLTFEMSLGG